MTAAEVARALGLSVAQSENAYKHARKRLAQRLEELVRDHVQRYCPAEEAEAEFTTEWGRLGEHLRREGGLEQAVRRAYADIDPEEQKQRRATAIDSTLTRLGEQLRRLAES